MLNVKPKIMRVIVNSKYRHLSGFIESLPERFESEGEILYQGRNQIKAFSIQAAGMVVKHYKRPNLVQKIVYRWMRPSKAKRAYLYALRLAGMGIDTPEAIAYIEKHRRGLFWDSWFISTRCGDESLFPVLVETPDYDRTIAKSLAHFLVGLHAKGFLHGDLNLANILYRKEKNGYHFTVIDINRSKFMDAPSQNECLHNLMRVTHRVDLLRDIITSYAQERGWDTEECCRKVECLLHEFEHRRARKYKWKKLFNK